MLYDPKWEKTDRVFQGVSLRSLISWLETQRPNKRYDFCLPFSCALAQFKQAQGAERDDSCVYIPGDGPDYWINEVAQGNGRPKDWTFGRMLERARAALSSTNSTTGE